MLEEDKTKSHKTNKEKPSEMVVITKAKDLMKYTTTITRNTNNFPKKDRPTIVNQMQLLTFEIYKGLVRANELFINIPTEKAQRQKYQREVIVNCALMNTLIELAHDLKIINLDRMKEWSKRVIEVKRMTASWKIKEATI